jgi:hypothetical protein
MHERELHRMIGWRTSPGRAGSRLMPALSYDSFVFIRGFLRRLVEHKEGFAHLELADVREQQTVAFLRSWRVVWASFEREPVLVVLKFQHRVIVELSEVETRVEFEELLAAHRQRREHLAPRKVR